MAGLKATGAEASDEDAIPVLVLIGQVGAGKSLLATALAGLPQENDVFMVGDSVNAVTTQTVCHRAQWFGLSTEEEVFLVDAPGIGDGEGRDAAHLAKVISVLQNIGRVNTFLVVLNSAQPRMGSTLNNLLQLMEECFGRQFWRHVALVFTRYYTDARSARRRGGRTQAAIRSEFSAALAAQFPNAMSQRIPPGEPFPCYFVDSEAVVNTDMPDTERNAAMLELERLSVVVRSTSRLPTYRSAGKKDIEKQESKPSKNKQVTLGTWVCIHGLDDMSALKSTEGRVVEIQKAEGWYVVELADGSRKPFRIEHLKHIADEHLQISTNTKVRIHGLVSSSALNGQVGHVVNYDSASQRYQVKLANGTVKLIKATNLGAIAEDMTPDEPELLALNAKVKLHGLTASPELNGKLGIIVGLPEDLKRCTVMLSDGSTKSVRFTNLQNVCVNINPGEPVNLVNISNGSLVERGLGWTWGDQDGGQGGLGRVMSWDYYTLWTKIRWNVGPVNSYRIGADGHFDLKFADEKSYGEEYQQALAIGKQALKIHHLQRTFFYSADPKALLYKFFDIRAEVCKCIGGFTHGQTIQWSGETAKVVGVAPSADSQTLQLYFHVSGSAGAGTFEEGERLRLVGTSVLHEAQRDGYHSQDEEPDNEALAKMATSLEPSFRYVEGCRLWEQVELQQYDIRDEVCKHYGVKHGQVLQTRPELNELSDLKVFRMRQFVVIGVRLLGQKPQLFIHEEGDPGASIISEGFLPTWLKVVSTRQVQEARNDELDPSPLSDELNEIAQNLRGTFNYPQGALFAEPGLFDIRDHVCMEVGGFRHGQVVQDKLKLGKKAVVIGVLDTGEKDPTELHLWFHMEGSPGAGRFGKYHLKRRDFKVIGTQSVEEVPTDHHEYKRSIAASFSHMSKHLTELCQNDDDEDDSESSDSDMSALIKKLARQLRGHCGDESKSSDCGQHRTASTVNLSCSFQYCTETSEVELFDIRDEVCLAIGGFKHGDVISTLGEQAIVIGVKLDKDDVPKLWVNKGVEMKQFPSDLKRLTQVIGHAALEAAHDSRDLGDPSAQPTWTGNLSLTFNYALAEGQLLLERFDIRDEVCLQVGGFTHGQVLQLANSVVVVVVGVMMVSGLPRLFTHTLKPERNLGATFIGDLRKVSVTCKGVEEVKEVTDVEFVAMKGEPHTLGQKASF